VTVTVRYDPFARGGLARESEGPGTCDWCGQHRRVLYSYAPERPAFHLPRPHLTSGRAFCNLGCFESYYS